MCLLLVKAGGCPEKWRSHGQKRKPFSKSEWIVIPELLPVIHTCFFLCQVVCSAVILKPSTSTSTFHLVIIPKLWHYLTVCMFLARSLENFMPISKTVCKRNVKGHVFPLNTLCSVFYRGIKDDIIGQAAAKHTVIETHGYILHFSPSHIFDLSEWQLLHLSQVLYSSQKIHKKGWIEKHSSTI